MRLLRKGAKMHDTWMVADNAKERVVRMKTVDVDDLELFNPKS